MTQPYNNCPVCNTKLPQLTNPTSDFSCPRCGKFAIFYNFESAGLSNPFHKLKNLSSKERANCSGLIRENQSVNIETILPVDEINKFINHRHPHIFEKADKLWEDAIELAIRKAGYSGKRIDKKEHINDINDEMLMEIRRSKYTIQFIGA